MKEEKHATACAENRAGAGRAQRAGQCQAPETCIGAQQGAKQPWPLPVGLAGGGLWVSSGAAGETTCRNTEQQSLM